MVVRHLPADDHNLLDGLQGGTTEEYYHLEAAQHTALTTRGDITGSDGTVTVTGGTSSIIGAGVDLKLNVNFQIDGGKPDSYYGGTHIIDGGTP